MHCPSCQYENPAEANFCLNCGTRLPKVCPSCQQLLPPEARFCMACGRALTAEARSGQIPTRGPVQPASWQAKQEDQAAEIRPPPAGRSVPEAERRQLTVLFCDLVGSTALSTRLDPEELREVMRAYHAVCTEVIYRFDGHIAQYLGDGLVVYFGYPRAHEDDAQRAVRAGLGIVEAMGRLNTRLGHEHGVSLAVRLGIHTGLVVVGEMGGGTRHEQMALGETPNLAARLQEVAEPDTVVISAATYRLVRGFFACQARGSHALKGISQPIAVYRVLQTSSDQSLFEVTGTAGLVP